MVVEEEISISVDGHAVPASLALPADRKEMLPGLIVIHEVLGLNDDIRGIARRFAESGYVAVSPDLFHGRGPQPICMIRTLAEYRAGGGRALEALEATRAWLATREDVDGARVGVVGFCMGGGFALLLGVRSTIGVVATFYGEVPKNTENLRGVCPVIGSYGGRDTYFAKQGGRLARMLAELGVAHEVKIYPDSGHAFMSRHQGITRVIGARGPLHTGYNDADAEDSWARMLRFFADHL